MEQQEKPSQKENEEGIVRLKILFDEMNPSPIISRNDFQFRAEIRNGTDREIEFPEGGTIEPKYHVKRPDGEVVTFSQMREPGPGEDPIGHPRLVQLAPGETWSDLVSLIPAYVDITLPGRYEVSATLNWKEIYAEATPIIFEVLPARFEGMAVTQSRYEKGQGPVEVLLLQRGAAGFEAVVAAYRPGHLLLPYRAEVHSPRTRGPLPEDTTGIMAPYLNYQISTHHLRWIIAQTPRGIHVGHDEGPEQTLIIPEYRIFDLLPSLAIRQPTLFFFGILHDGRNLFHLAFSRLDYPVTERRNPKGEAIPKTLPFKSIFEMDDYAAASVALGPHALGSPLVAGIALRSDDLTGAEFILLRVGHDGEIEAKKSVAIPGAVPLKAAALNIDTGGKLRAAFVVKEKKGGRVRLVEITGSHDLAILGPPRIVPISDTIDPAARLDLRYFESRGVGRILLIRQPGKKAMVFDRKEILRPSREDVPYDRPVELVISEMGWDALVMYSDHVEVIEGL